MKNFGQIISDKDIITKEYLDSKGYISAITSKMVTDALGFTPFDSAAFTKASIKNALGIADWALAANKPSYDDVYLKLTGGTITGNLTVNGKVSASGLSISTATASLTFTDNIIYSNASLRIYGGWSLRLGANATGIQEWTDLKSILGLGSLAYKNSIEASDISAIAWSKVTGKPTTLSGYGITDAMVVGASSGTDLNETRLPGSYTNFDGVTNAPASGNFLTIRGSNDYFISQIHIQYNGQMRVRARGDAITDNDYWTVWREILDNVSGDARYLKLAGGTMSGVLNMNGYSIDMGGAQLGNVGKVIHRYSGAFNMDEYGNFYAPSDATDSGYWGFKRADGNNALSVYAGSGLVQTHYDTQLARYGGVVNIGNAYNRANTNVYGDFKVIGYPAEFQNGITLGGETITSWSFAWSKITGKPTTLAGYGITDAVYQSNYFDATSAKPWVLGYSNTSYGWKATGPAMLFGTASYYARLNVMQEGTDNPTAHISLVHAGVEYGWAKVLTEKNIRSHAIEIAPASERRSATDTSAFTTYAYGDNGWKETGPALAFPNGSYKGLIQLTLANVASNPQSYTRMFIGSVRPDSEGGQQPWVEVLTEKSQGVMRGRGRLAEADADTLSEAGVYEFWGGGAISNVPSGYSTMLVSRGTDNNLYFTSQLLTDVQGHLYSRMSEGYTLNWKPWRTILDDNNISSYAISQSVADSRYLKLTGGTITGNLTLYGNRALMGDTPTGGIYPRFRMFMHSDGLFFQAATYDGTSNAGNVGFTGYGGTAANDIYFNATTIRFLGTSSFNSALTVSGLFTANGGINLNGETITSWSFAWSKITSKPTTLSGYGITDALPKSGGIITGTLSVTGALTVNGGIAMNDGTVYTSWNDIRAMDATIWGGTSHSVPLTPNEKMRLQGGITGTWTFTLSEPNADRAMVKFYYLEFTTGSTVPTINFSKTLKWKDGKTLQANIQANKTYRLLIDDNLASWEVYY